MEFPEEQEPDIDLLLADYGRGLDSFAAIRDVLEPIIMPLQEELSTFLASPDAEEERLPMIMILRSQYFRALQDLEPAIAEWVGIRDAGEQLWLVEPYMSEEQWKQFGQLQARELADGERFDRFQATHKDLRPKLLVLSEMTG